MKSAFYALALSNLLVHTSAWAEQKPCDPENYSNYYKYESDPRNWSNVRCTMVGTGVAVSAGSGIYAAKKYSQANSIEKEFTQRLFVQNQMNSGTNSQEVRRRFSAITDGDRITIGYNLSESENRNHHINLMESNATAARAAAAAATVTAVSAMKPSYNAQGKPNGLVPDHAARAVAAALAASKFIEAGKWDQEAANARAGGPVPTYRFDQVIDEKAQTVRLATDFTEERLARGGTILDVDRLPVEHFNTFKALRIRAAGGLAGVAVGVGLGIEEAVEGYVARKIRRSLGAPTPQGYYDETSRYGY